MWELSRMMGSHQALHEGTELAMAPEVWILTEKCPYFFLDMPHFPEILSGGSSGQAGAVTFRSRLEEKNGRQEIELSQALDDMAEIQLSSPSTPAFPSLG